MKYDSPNCVPIPTYKAMKESPEIYPFGAIADMQGKDFCFVVEAFDKIDGLTFSIYDAGKCFLELRKALLKYGVSLWWVCHDKDYDENGEMKLAHYHCVVSCQKLMRFFQLFTLICSVFGASVLYVDEGKYKLNNFLQLEKCDNLFGAIAYLIHYNDPDKTQYQPEAVYCTADDRLIFESVVLMGGCLSMKGIIALVQKAQGNYKAVMCALPFAVAIRCNAVIKNFCNDFSNLGVTDECAESDF